MGFDIKEEKGGAYVAEMSFDIRGEGNGYSMCGKKLHVVKAKRS